MPSDATTFFLSFAAFFVGLAAYLWHLETKVTRLERRLEATTPKNESDRGKP